ncbi:MAG: 50S ribosomal protein L10 [bacterium]
MNKIGKAETVEALKAAIAAQRGAVVASFRGLKVLEITALRKKLRAIDAEIRVVKNTLIRRAVEGTPFEGLSAHFTGPTAVAFAHGDPVAMAKVMKEFAAASPKVTLRAGFVEGRVLSAKDVEILASVPSREVLLSRMAGGLASPITRLAQALVGPPRKLVYVLESIRKQKNSQNL